MTRKLGASIVVPTRGGVSRLPVLLGALAIQDTDDFEVIVVLDGDVDGSENLLRRVAPDVPYSLRWIAFPENRGRSAALNAGADAAGGRVLIRSDDDLEPNADFVSGHIERHRSARNGVIGLTTNRFPKTAYARNYGNRADQLHRAEAQAAASQTLWRHWSANVSITKDIHDLIGGYDERYTAYGWEDVDFGYRLRLAGVPIVVAPELLTIHHAASTTTAIRSTRALHSGAARDTFLSIHGRDALPEPTRSTGVWNRTVWAASNLTTEKSIRVWSAMVDRVAEALPRPFAEKLIALTVESAGLAGIRYPERAKSRF